MTLLRWILLGLGLCSSFGHSIWAGDSRPCVRSTEFAKTALEAEKKGHWQVLEDLGSRAIQACPADGVAYRWMGIARLRRGATFAAVRDFRQALKRGDGPVTHLLLAEAYFVLNQHHLFADEIAAAKAGNPGNPEPYYLHGRYKFQTENRFDAAAEQFEQALRLDPRHLKAQCYLGISLNNMQRAEEAERQLLKAVELVEERKIAYYLPYRTLASLYLEQGRADEALTYIRTAVEMAPDVALNQFLLGKAAWAGKDADTAVGALRAACSLDDAFLEAHYLLAQIFESRGDGAGARRHLEEFKAKKDLYGVGRLR